MYDWFYADQLLRHLYLKSFGDEKYKVMITFGAGVDEPR